MRLKLNLLRYNKNFMSIKNKIFIRLFLLIPFLGTFKNFSQADDNIKNLTYSYSEKEGFVFYLRDIGKMKIGTEMECSFVRDGALYASFGLEAQIYHCSKVVFNFEGTFDSPIEDHSWIYKMDFAPLYQSIKAENKDIKIYKKDSKNNEIDGNNHYFDWYKNLGSRTYYVGNAPLIETYAGYQTAHHLIKFGRMKGIVGLDDKDVFWGDDAKFAPFGHWLSRDLLTGATYVFHHSFFEVKAAIFSGSNPAKGYANYLDRVESPNIKSNNTPSLSGRLQLNYNDLLAKNVDGFLYASYLSNFTGSTWDDGLKDGKRNNLVGAYGGVLNLTFDNLYINSVSFFGQYTHFTSGLRTKGSQNDKSKKFKNIFQKGYFVGLEIKSFDNKLSLGAAYEKFDRFDYNLFRYYLFADNNPYLNSIQKSVILNARYNINSIISVGTAYHRIDNPAPFVSNILDKKKMNKFKVSLYLNF